MNLNQCALFFAILVFSGFTLYLNTVATDKILKLITFIIFYISWFGAFALLIYFALLHFQLI